MRYLIIEKLDAEKLSDAVNEHLEDGWELYGAPMMAAYETEAGDQTIYAQALTNEQDAVEPTEADVDALAEFLNRPIDELTLPEKENRAKMVELIELAKGRILRELDQDPETE